MPGCGLGDIQKFHWVAKKASKSGQASLAPNVDRNRDPGSEKETLGLKKETLGLTFGPSAHLGPILEAAGRQPTYDVISEVS